MKKNISLFFILCLLILTSGCIRSTHSKRYYSFDIEINPETNNSFFIYLPLMSFNIENIIEYKNYIKNNIDEVNTNQISTKFGEAINLSSKGFIHIETDGSIEEPKGEFRITLEDSSDETLYERTTFFNIYMSSFNNNMIYINFNFERTSEGGSDYYAKIEFSGVLKEGWNVLEGSINVDQN